jgi:hypothetical protein
MTAEQPAHLRHPKHTDLHIFTRETGGWYAGVHRDGKYHRKATKTDHLPTAMALAEDWCLDCKSEIRLNLFEARARHSVNDAAKLALGKFKVRVERGERSDLYLKGIELLLQTALLPFFGALDVTKVGPAKWSEYETYLRAIKQKLTRQTLHQHRNALTIPLLAITHGRHTNPIPLVYDLMEPLRPVIDRKVLEFALSHTFTPRGFHNQRSGRLPVKSTVGKGIGRRCD